MADQRPATLGDLESLIAYEAQQAKVPPDLALRLAKAESTDPKTGLLNPRAKSPKGAMGIMQLMPTTAAQYRVLDPYDPVENVRAGLKHFRGLLTKYNGDPELSLAAYNAGEDIVDRMKGVPNYPETKAYIAKILGGLNPDAAQTSQRGSIGAGPLPPEALGMAPPMPAGRLTPKSGPVPLLAEVGSAPPILEQIGRATLPVAGAAVGGAKGMAFGAAAGAPLGPYGAAAGGALGGLSGAALGAMGGESLEMVIEEGLRVAGVRKAQPITPAGAVHRVGGAGIAGMEGEILGQGVSAIAAPVAGKLLAPFKSKVEPYAKEAIETFQGQVLPSEISKSRILGVGENIAEGSFLGGEAVTKVKEARQLIAEARVHGVLASLGPRQGTKATGQAVQGARESAIKAFRGAEKQAWEQEFRPLAEKIPAASPRLDAFIAEVEGQQAGAILPNAGLTAARRVASLAPEADTIMYGGRETSLSNLPATVQEAIAQAGAAPPSTKPLTAFQFQQTVSDLGKLKSALEKAAVADPGKNRELGLVKQLYSLARADMEETLSVSSKALDAYDAARSLSRFGNKQLFNDEIRKLADLAPEKLVGAITKRDNSTAIEAVRRAVDPATFHTVQAEALKRLIRPNSRTGSVNWGQVAKRIDDLGPDSLQALFPKGHDKEVRRVAELMLELNQKPAGGIGKIAVQLGQGGAVVGLATGTFTSGFGTILLTPMVMAKVFASPTGLKWLSEGLKAPAGSPIAVRAATNLLSFMQKGDEPSAPEFQGEAPPRAQGPGPTRGVGGAPPSPR